MTTSETLLKVADLQAWYGESKALHGMDFEVRKGELVTLIGRNGAGKSTTLRSITGIVRKRSGSVVFDGSELIGLRTYQIARRGVAYCPEERAIFASLTVSENLTLPPVLAPGGLEEEVLLDQFPQLRNRLGSSSGTKLSGGEQQMLAIARILRTGARFLLLDEPSEGLAPVVVKEIADQILQLKKMGFTILLVEQNLKFARRVADRHVVVENGKVVDTLDADALAANLDRVKSYLGV